MARLGVRKAVLRSSSSVWRQTAQPARCSCTRGRSSSGRLPSIIPAIPSPISWQRAGTPRRATIMVTKAVRKRLRARKYQTRATETGTSRASLISS